MSAKKTKKNKNKNPINLVTEYDMLNPELSAKQKLINLAKAFHANGLHKALTGKDIPKSKKKTTKK